MEDYLITAEHPKLDSIHFWIKAEKTVSKAQPQYKHIFLEEIGAREDILDELFEYINHAHEGARQCIRAPLGDSLHPFRNAPDVDPSYGYPQIFEENTLKGFFGEIFAGIVAEYYSSDEKFKWEVPVFLFRTHIMGFQQLEYMKQTQDYEHPVFGRTGDDCLAFARNASGDIIGWLACEAKCTSSHNSTLISDNHKKLSTNNYRPIDLLRTIEALKDYRNDEYSQKWVKSLENLFYQLAKNPESSDRQNLSMYVYGQSPKQTKTWVPTDKPHKSYNSSKKLISAEFFIDNISDLIQRLYSRMDSTT